MWRPTKPKPRLNSRTLTAGITSCCVGVFFIAHKILQLDDAWDLSSTGCLVNIVLSGLKAGLAQLTGSHALKADAVHGLGDTVAEVVIGFSFAMAREPPDEEHPWGHGKYENLGTMIMSLVLGYAAMSLGWESIESLSAHARTHWSKKSHAESSQLRRRPSLDAPAGLRRVSSWPLCSTQTVGTTSRKALSRGESLPGQRQPWIEKRFAHAAGVACTLVSLVLKEALFQATMRVGAASESPLLVAAAWHHRSDAFAAGLALLAQVGSSIGQPFWDPLGGSIVTGMLMHSSAEGLYSAVGELLDKRADSQLHEELASSIATVAGVKNHSLRARKMGPFCVADVTVVVDQMISASAASQVAEAVHSKVKQDHPSVTDVMVHVDPVGSPQYHSLEPWNEKPGASGAEADWTDPKAIEDNVRKILAGLPTKHPTLPRILGASEIQTYFQGEKKSGHGIEKDRQPPYSVMIKVDLQLQVTDELLVRDAQRACAVAQRAIEVSMPYAFVDVDLEINESTPLLVSLPVFRRGTEARGGSVLPDSQVEEVPRGDQHLQQLTSMHSTLQPDIFARIMWPPLNSLSWHFRGALQTFYRGSHHRIHHKFAGSTATSSGWQYVISNQWNKDYNQERLLARDHPGWDFTKT